MWCAGGPYGKTLVGRGSDAYAGTGIKSGMPYRGLAKLFTRIPIFREPLDSAVWLCYTKRFGPPRPGTPRAEGANASAHPFIRYP